MHAYLTQSAARLYTRYAYHGDTSVLGCLHMLEVVRSQLRRYSKKVHLLSLSVLDTAVK